jgi:hypothetical protein
MPSMMLCTSMSLLLLSPFSPLLSFASAIGPGFAASVHRRANALTPPADKHQHNDSMVKEEESTVSRQELTWGGAQGVESVGGALASALQRLGLRTRILHATPALQHFHHRCRTFQQGMYLQARYHDLQAK